MINLVKSGSWAAFYMATAYVVGIILFIFVLDYPHIVDPSQKIALLIKMPNVVYLTNLLMYVFFGIALIVFTLAINERLKHFGNNIIKMASVLGFVWATVLFGSGMISNAGIETAITLSKRDMEQAANYWAGIETVANGLSCVNGEILGGIFTLLISIVCLRIKGFSKMLTYLGILVGTIGVVSIVPGLKDLTGIFGITQIIWFVWFGLILQSKNDEKA